MTQSLNGSQSLKKKLCHFEIFLSCNSSRDPSLIVLVTLNVCTFPSETRNVMPLPIINNYKQKIFLSTVFKYVFFLSTLFF